MVYDAVQTANKLRAHYRNTYSTPYYRNVNSVVAGWAGPGRESRLTEVTIDEAGMIESLKKLRKDSAPGPDRVPAILLRRYATTLARPLVELWRRSFEAGMVPEALKEGIVTPIFRGGDRGDCSNYRLVVLCHYPFKVF